MSRINKATKHALFNARRRYNNAKARANTVPNSDPEAKNSALNDVMARASNYLTAVKGARVALQQQSSSVNIIAPPPLPSASAAAPRTTLRNRMRAAITRRYGVANVPNTNVNAFLAGHMEYNDPEINAIYGEHQAMQPSRRGGQHRSRRQRSHGGNGNNNDYNTNVWSVATPSLNEVKKNQQFIEGYNTILQGKKQTQQELMRAYRELKASLAHMIPGSQAHMEAHQELSNIDAKLRALVYDIMYYMPIKRNTLKRNLSFSNRLSNRR